MKRLCADDSAATSVKVGYRQASYKKSPTGDPVGFFALYIESFSEFCRQGSRYNWLIATFSGNHGAKNSRCSRCGIR
ncbi:hypothetical protein MASSI9I_140008 [Massilia sp. 9I]|nr:hypothetical protein MASSI9I_140008 [Massilia sp. 9I]